MVTRIYKASIIDMLKTEENNPDGDTKKVLDYILELEQSGQYSPANICALKATYYSHIDDEKLAFYWEEQAYLLDPTDTDYSWTYTRRLMSFNRFNEALPILSKVIDLEKEMGIQWYTSIRIFFKAVCYYYLKDYKNCHHYLKDLEDDFSAWVAGGLHSKAEMMNVLRGFGYV